MSDELKMGYGRCDEVKSHPLIRGPLATLDERNAATIATLRTQLAAMTAERDAERLKVATLQSWLIRAIDMCDWIGCSEEGYDQMCNDRDRFIEETNNILEATK